MSFLSNIKNDIEKGIQKVENLVEGTPASTAPATTGTPVDSTPVVTAATANVAQPVGTPVAQASVLSTQISGDKVQQAVTTVLQKAGHTSWLDFAYFKLGVTHVEAMAQLFHSPIQILEKAAAVVGSDLKEITKVPKALVTKVETEIKSLGSEVKSALGAIDSKIEEFVEKVDPALASSVTPVAVPPVVPEVTTPSAPPVVEVPVSTDVSVVATVEAAETPEPEPAPTVKDTATQETPTTPAA